MRDVNATLKFYRDNKDDWPFNPNGMCLKICRTARLIGPMYPTALASQLATPVKYRVYSLKDVRRGMVMYFDDPNDSNPAGHIVTALGRDTKGGILTWSNDIVPNVLKVVYSSYYLKNWGDRFQFAATWLNGVELDTGVNTHASDDKDPKRRKLKNLQHAIADLERMIAHHKKKGNDRLVKALQRDLRTLRKTLKEFQ